MWQNKFLKGFQKILKNKLFRFLVLFFLLIIFLLLGHFSYSSSKYIGQENTELTFIQENSLVAVSVPNFPKIYVYGSLNTFEREIDIEQLLKEVIRRESNGNPKICNLKFGCGSGAGLCGFIPRTWNSTLERMKENDIYMPSYCWQEVSLPISENHPIFNSECHLIVCEWLLRTDGTKHWDSSGEWWGSGPYDLETFYIYH